MVSARSATPDNERTADEHEVRHPASSADSAHRNLERKNRVQQQRQQLSHFGRSPSAAVCALRDPGATPAALREDHLDAERNLESRSVYHHCTNIGITVHLY